MPRSALRSLWWTHREPPPRNPWQFLKRNVWPWLTHYVGVMFHRRHDFPTYKHGNGIFPLPGECTIALAGDWGTGTESAYKVADRIREAGPEVTIHLGDVYYSGTADEYRRWFLGDDDWPRGTIYTFAMNANHEMYSGGGGYFDAALPELKQETSYFCLENAHWRILGLDTGYYSGIFPLLEPLLRSKIRLHDDILRWLEAEIFPDDADRRSVILLTHHELFSAFDSEYATLRKNLAPYVGRVCLWFWGHEHRFAGYAPLAYGGLGPIRARCIGHGGMPIEVSEKPTRASERNLVFYDNRPDHTKGLEKPVGYCGFALLRLSGPALEVRYVDEDGTELLVERWVTGDAGCKGSLGPSSPDLKPVAGRVLTELVSS